MSLDPRHANGAQIPLADFNIPQFPREAGGLMALTLSCAIEQSTYASELARPFKITRLPPAIQSLTLEHFSLGYPTGFLAAVGKELPELRSLVLYSQLLGGYGAESLADAVGFFEGTKKLRALHLLDTFVQPGFLAKLAPVLRGLERPLISLELNYTCSAPSQESGFLAKIPADEIPLLVGPGLVSCSFNAAAAAVETDSTSSKPSVTSTAGLGHAIQVVDAKHSKALIKALIAEETAPRALKGLNTTLYPLTAEQLRDLITKHTGLMALNVSITVADTAKWKSGIFNALARSQTLEMVEIVLCPADDVFIDISVEEKELSTLSVINKKLNSFKINQLRSSSLSSVDCNFMGGRWQIKKTDSTA